MAGGRLQGEGDEERAAPPPGRSPASATPPGIRRPSGALRELGTLEQTEPRDGDEAVRDELTRRACGYVQADADAWLAHVLAARLGHYRDPAAREAAAGLLPPPVLAHAVLLAELALLVPGASVAELAFAARLATTEPEASGALAAFLARVEGPQV
ncbi:hypothetical protein ABT269_39715 [Streptomyces viridosporus]|uniref:hypothetical protein n=1 Tax=Streptomyces viridosporus TaxID=67581 RepID=UPI00332E636F